MVAYEVFGVVFFQYYKESPMDNSTLSRNGPFGMPRLIEEWEKPKIEETQSFFLIGRKEVSELTVNSVFPDAETIQTYEAIPDEDLTKDNIYEPKIFSLVSVSEPIVNK